MNDLFTDFKSIRNILVELNLWDLLDKLYKIKNNKRRNIVPEVIEFLYLNTLVYSPEYRNIKASNDEKKWNKAILLSINFHDKINAAWIDQKGPWIYLQKGALNQLKSGSVDYFRQLYRYYYIFSKDNIVKHVETKIDMSYKDFINCAMWLHSVFKMKSYCVEKSYFLQLNDAPLSDENITKVLNILSIQLKELKSTLKTEIKYDLDTFITHDYIHLKKTIFESNEKLYCLYPEQLLNQFTSGVYYLAEIFDNKHNLANEFGTAFEDYVGLILEKNKQPNKFKIQKEILYNISTEQLKTSDWIINADNAIIFIECKTKRLTIRSKKVEEVQHSDKIEIAKAVFQIYKVYLNYSKNLIPNLEFDSKKKLIPIILTLEEWYAGAPDFNEDITRLVKGLFIENKLDVSIVDVFKFHINSVSSFEKDVQIMTKFGFKEFYEGNIAEMKENFKYESYFKDEIYQLFIEPLENKKTTP